MIDRHTGSAAAMDEIRREVGAILTEMNQTTERNIALIEDRLKRLQELIGQADQRLGNLRREARRQESSEMVYSHLSRVVRPVGPQSSPTEGADEPAAGGRAESVGSAQSSDGPENDSETGAEMSLKDRVLDLYRQGLPIERIASRVGTAVSEIELIVSLGERQ
ncbi:MAG: hypothetical protein V3S41_04870 [Spirochaetia bacterium]